MNILVTSFHFAPYLSAEGLVAYKLFNDNKYFNEVEVILGKKKDFPKLDDEILKDCKVDLIEVDCDSKFLPSKLKWLYKSIKQIKRKDLAKYNFLHSRSMPIESHILSYIYYLKLKKRIPWIVSFSDPIYRSPYHDYSTIYGKMKKYIFKIFEHIIIKNCDVIIFNNDYQRDYMLENYKNKKQYRKKSFIIPHSYEEAWYPKVAPNNNNKTIVTHTGSLDEKRSPINLFKALSSLRQDGVNINEHIEFRFFGNVSEKYKKYIEELGLERVVKLKGSVGYLESLKQMELSDYLLLIDGNFPTMKKNPFFASKLADYLGANRPIIGLTMNEGISSQILEETNNLVCGIDNIDRIKIILNKIIKNNGVKMEKENNRLSSYNVKREFTNILEKIDKNR